jgi:hypothetical protein
VKEWDQQFMDSYAKHCGKQAEEEPKEPKTGKELDKRLGNLKSLLAHLNSPSDEDVLRGIGSSHSLFPRPFFCSFWASLLSRSIFAIFPTHLLWFMMQASRHLNFPWKSSEPF